MYSFTLPENFPKILPAFIEISKGSNIKYEWDEKNQVLTLDRILHSSVVYPENYGFIPQTLCDDGDPLDVLILSNQKLLPGTIAYVRPICYMDMTDEKGKDEKLLAVLEKEPYFTYCMSINDVSEHKLKEIREFFGTYKNLEQNKWSKIENWNDYDKTIQLIEQCHYNYLIKLKKP
jgi:inorganic pyrophosphatase